MSTSVRIGLYGPFSTRSKIVPTGGEAFESFTRSDKSLRSARKKALPTLTGLPSNRMIGLDTAEGAVEALGRTRVEQPYGT